jgi:cell division protein FtsZ
MGKRASMREGPLAALFAATEESLEDAEITVTASGNGNGSVAVEAEAEVVEVEPVEVESVEVEAEVADVEPEIVEAPKPKPKAKPKAKPKPKPKRKAKAAVKPKPPKPKQKAKPEPEPVAEVEVEEAPVEVAEPEVDEVEIAEPQAEPLEVEVEGTTLPRERLREHLITEPLDQPAFGRGGPDTTRQRPLPRSHNAVLTVVGVGGAGVNAVNRMEEAGIEGVNFVAVNTDLQSLQTSNAEITLHIGAELTRGLGSGADPRVGYRAAYEEQDRIKEILKGSDMVFVTAGAGGGTGTGAAPVVARLAHDVGALTVGVVTKPFSFEGRRRIAQAEEGVSALGAEVDTLIVVPNEKLLTILERRTSMVDAFAVADDVLRQAVQGIADLVTLPGLINLDFADVRTTMLDAGDAILGIGMDTGEHRALHAAEKAVQSPLLDTSVDGARSLLLSITGGPDLSLLEAADAAKVVQEAAHPDANIIFGANIDEDLGEQVWVTVIATRFESAYSHRHQRKREDRGGPREPGARPQNPTAGLGSISVPEFIPGH